MNSANQTETFIEIKDVEKVYQVGDNQVPVLKGLSTTVDRGEFIAITGPSGNGKSTLLKMLAGITEYEGKILIDGQDLKDCTYESLAKNIAYISQHPKLFNKSILYNISYGTNH